MACGTCRYGKRRGPCPDVPERAWLRQDVMNIALFGRSADLKDRGRFEILFGMLSSCGCAVYVYEDFYDKLVRAFPGILSCSSFPSAVEIFSSPSQLRGKTDMFFSLGGDGTILDSIVFTAGTDIPVAGINFGRLGFLTTASIDENGDNPWFAKLLSSDYIIERKYLLELSSESMPESFYPYALNEISLQRTDASMLNIRLEIDGTQWPSYWSDGLLISTPTGSTAYSLSVGGPVVMPSSNVLVVAPISPHNLNVRPLVVPEKSEFSLTVHTRAESALVTSDNRSFKVPSGEKLHVSISDYYINYVCLRRSRFIDALTEKLMWGKDRRNNEI